MRRLALACAVLAAALVAATLIGDRVTRARTATRAVSRETRLPARTGEDGRAVSDDGSHAGSRSTAPRIRLKANGALLLNDEPVGLAELRRLYSGRTVSVVEVDDAVPWSSVEWVLAALQTAVVRRVRFDLPDGAAEICFDSDYWKQDASRIPGGHTAGEIVITSADLVETDVARKVGDEAARIRCEVGLRPLGEIYPDTGQAFGAVAPALRAFRDAGVEVELRFLGPVTIPDSIPQAIKIVEGERSEPLMPSLADPFPRCRCAAGVLALELPVADMGEQDRAQEEDDRLILNLDAHGRVFWRKDLNLAELAGALKDARERYVLKMKQLGKSGVETPRDGAALSKLYTLIRADRAAPARHVGWILHVLAEEGFYKVEFAVASGDAEEATVCVGTLDRKIVLFLPTDNLPHIVGKVEPFVRVYVDRGAYGVGGVGGLDARGVGTLVRAEYDRAWEAPGRKLVLALEVDPDVAWGRVAAAIGEIMRQGVDRIDLHGLPPPDEATRKLAPLPRW